MITRPPNAAILAIGTELTSGQITNRNAAWISEKLTNLGVNVALHETVADDRQAISEALVRCLGVLDTGGLLFVTGGLGPTTDDFTREVIADWIHKPLVFQEASWQRIQERLGRFGVPVAESNRQQCFFPEGAEVLPNPRGTADAFTFKCEPAQVWVLPGPPAEIAAIWESGGIEKTIRERMPATEPCRLLTWQCLGKSEAELGEITESILQGSGLKTGYRAYRPYIEVKVWCPQTREKEAAPFLKKLENTLSPWTVARKEGEVVKRFLQSLIPYDEIEILDVATGGILTERLNPFLRSAEFNGLTSSLMIATEWFAPLSDENSPEAWILEAMQQAQEGADEQVVTLALCGFSAKGEWAVGLRNGETTRHATFQVPYRKLENPESLERAQRYAAELAMHHWATWLERSLQ